MFLSRFNDFKFFSQLFTAAHANIRQENAKHMQTDDKSKSREGRKVHMERLYDTIEEFNVDLERVSYYQLKFDRKPC